MNNPPFPRSYWVVAGKLLAGCYPWGQTPDSANQKINGLVEAGITDVVTLMETSETNHSGQSFTDYLPFLEKASKAHGRIVRRHRHAIVDGSTTTPERVHGILDTIDSAISGGGTVYVHCWGGRGRTGTIVCCWLIRHGIATPANAIAHMHALIGDRMELFSPTPENEKQRQFIEAWPPGKPSA